MATKMDISWLLIVLMAFLEVDSTLGDCANQPPPFGMENGVIQNNQITSSSFASGFPPYSGRLNNFYGAWCADSQTTKEWLQVDLGSKKELLAVETEGFWTSYITGYYLLYSFDAVTWYCFGYEGTPKKLSSSIASSTHVLHNRPVVRYVRINPTEWVGKICLKIELYGCSPSSDNSNSQDMPKTCNLDIAATTPPPTTVYITGPTTQGPTLPPGVTTQSTVPPPTTQPTTQLTTTVEPITWQPIDSIRIRVTKTTVYSGETISIGLYYHQGSEPKYRWDLGDGTLKYTKWFNHQYRSPGIYLISVYGFNVVSNASDSTYMLVQDRIIGLKLIGDVKPMVPNTVFNIQWNIDKGTNVTYTVKYGDSTANKVIIASEVGQGPYSLKHKYVSIGHFTVEISGSNLVSTAGPIKKTVIVEEPLVDLHVKWTLPRRLNYNTTKIFIAVGEEITTEMSVKSGTDPKYRVYFGEQTLELNSKSNIVYTFSKPGIYTIKAESYNHLNVLSQYYRVPINVQHDEKIVGLQIEVSPTILGFTTPMILSLQSGTAFVCVWSFGDGAIARRDVTNYNDTMYHEYDSFGFYDVNVFCENRHGNSSVQVIAIVSIPIVKPNIFTDHKPLATNSTQIFTVILKNGSDVAYNINFGDGNSLQVHLPNTSARDKGFYVNHTYKEVGVYYVTVDASNSLGSEKAILYLPIIVQNPMKKEIISLDNKSPVKIPDGKVEFNLELLSMLNVPTNVTCLWYFGDMSTVVQTSFPKTIQHTFAYESWYVISVLCSNKVSSVRVNSTVRIYRMVVPRMTIDSPEKIIDQPSQKIYIPSGANITFCVTTQPYDRTYVWSGLSRHDTSIKSDSCISSVIVEPRDYEITVVVNNSLEIMTANSHFKVQKKVNGLNVQSNGSSIIREFATIMWTARVFGTDACYLLTFNDSSPTVIFGSSTCSKDATQLPDTSKPVVVKHKYMKEGLYNVIVKGRNMVSSVTASTTATVVKPVCEISDINITSNAKVASTFKFLRSQTFELQVKYHQQCYFGEGVDLSWKLFKNSSNKETVVSLNSLQTRRKEYLSFNMLDLAYGIYRAETLVTLVGAVLKEIYGVVSKYESVHFEILPSPLQAKIKGGSHIMVDPDVSFNLDGGDSADPDEYIPYLNLRYTWYCKRKLKHNNQFIGCYSSNTNHLEPVGYDRILFTVSKELIRNTSYYFTLEVTKSSRVARAYQTVFVSFGLPPKMKITCLPDCDGRLIPSKSLVLLSECISCGDSEVSLGNKWEISELVNGTVKPRKILPSETRYGLTTPRFELLPNILTPGNHYVAILSAWKQGGLPGYTNYTFVAYKNKPPMNGNCTTSPDTGFALDTSFVIQCVDWQDQDPPLTYTFTYTLGKESTVVYSGDQNQRTFKLPIAEGADNSTINITAEIQDVLGMSTLTFQTVLVSKPKPIDISNILNVVGGGGAGGGGLGGLGGGSSGSGGSGQNQTAPKRSAAEVAQLASLVAYSLNNAGSGEDKNTSAEDTKKSQQLRATIANQLSSSIKDLGKSNTTSVSDLDLVTNAMRDLTKNPGELTLSALLDIGAALSDITSILKRLADMARLGSLSEAERLKLIGRIKSVANKILETLSNIMMGIAALSEKCETLQPFEQSVTQVKSLIKKVIHSLDEISILLLSFMRVGDEPMLMNTDFVNITLERNNGSSIDGRNYKCFSGSLVLPETVKLMPGYNMTTNKVIDVKFMEYKNIYQFCESPKDVTYGLVHFNLLQDTGVDHDISKSISHIEVNVSRLNHMTIDDYHVSYNVNPLNGTTRFHKINWTLPDTAVNIELLPNSTHFVTWKVYVIFGEDEVLSGQWPLLRFDSSNDTNTSYGFQMSRENYKNPGIYKIYIKVELSSELEELWKSHSLNISYSLGIYQSRCLFWSENENAYNSEGCKVGPKSTIRKTQCLCNRFGAFGSYISTMTSELGFDSPVIVATVTTLSPIVLVLVILVLCIYVILFIWAWWKDMQDKEKDDVVHLIDNHPKYKFKYEIKVFTGLSKQAGSTGNVCCIIKGEDGQTSVRALHDVERQRFQRSAVDVFLLCTPLHLGRLNFLEIWHDNSGDDPSWYLLKVSIRDVLKDELYYFMCNQWLAVEHHDGQVSRTLPVAKPEEVQAFKHLFTSVARNKLTDKHLWLSVFTRPSRSRFSRAERLSCCLTFVYCIMFFNSLFYETWGKSDSSITMLIGPLRLSPHQIHIGLLSNVIMFPIIEVIVGIFRSVKAKRDEVDDDDGKLKDAPLISSGKDLLQLIDWYRIAGQSETMLHQIETGDDTLNNKKTKQNDFHNTISTIFQDENVISSPLVKIGINEDSGQALQKTNTKKFKLPYYFAALGWFYFLGLSTASAYFVAHFGMQYEEELASQWLTSVVISLFFDIVIINTLRVLIIALIYALVLKRPDESDYESDIKGNEIPQSNSCEYDITKTMVVFPPNKEELEEARTKKLKEIQMDNIIRDMIIYVFFLTSLLVVSYSHRDPQAFAVAQNLMDKFISGKYTGNGLSQNDGTSNYWSWIENNVLQSLSADNRTWAPRCTPYSNYSIDCNTIVIGKARLRQLRVPPESCSVPPGMEIVSKTCNTFYSLMGEDRSNYTKSWIPTNKTMQYADPWTYQSMFKIGGIPYFGLLATYSGGGYITDLSNTGDGIQELKENNWINQRTRAVFLEVSIYNAQVDMFGIATFLTEWMPTNGVLFFDNVKAPRLFIPTDTKQKVTTVCQIFMALFLMVFIYGEAKKVRKEKKQYFKDVWNWMEVCLIVFTLGCLGSLYQRSKYTTKAIQEMQENPDKFINLMQAATFDEVLTYFLGLVVFVANLKLLKLFRFNHRVFLFTRTLSTASDPLLSFMLVFAIFYIAFCSIYYLIFGTIMAEYKSLMSTIVSLFNILLGGFDFNSMEAADRIYGPILFFSFMMIMVMILMNTFLTILMDAFADVQGDENLKDDELPVLDHFLSRVEKYRRRNKVASMDTETEERLDEISIVQTPSIEEEQEEDKEEDSGDEEKGKNSDDDLESEEEYDEDDVLQQAIRRAQLKVKMKQMLILSRGFQSAKPVATFKPLAKERTLDEKLKDITSCFSCAVLDDIALDRAYEEMLRTYVKNIHRDHYDRQMREQNEFAMSWQAPKRELKQTKRTVYDYTRHSMNE